MKKCPQCKRTMTPLLVSCVCDYCDGINPLDAPFVGYVVFHTDFTFPVKAYVFSRPEHAVQWYRMRGPNGASIHRVNSTHPFNWRMGIQATANLEFNDTLVEIHADSRYEPGPHKAFLGPKVEV